MFNLRKTETGDPYFSKNGCIAKGIASSVRDKTSAAAVKIYDNKGNEDDNDKDIGSKMLGKRKRATVEASPNKRRHGVCALSTKDEKGLLA